MLPIKVQISHLNELQRRIGTALATGARVHLATVGQVRDKLNETKTPVQLKAFREAVLVWRPLQDRLVNLFLETVEGEAPSLTAHADESPSVGGGWPCQVYSANWPNRMASWLQEFDGLRKQHSLTGRPHRQKEHFAQLVDIARRVAARPKSLSGRDVGRVRLILAHALHKHGRPDSEECQLHRRKHAAVAARPLHSELASVLVKRMTKLPRDQGLDDPRAICFPLTADEEREFHLPAGTAMPDPIVRQLHRCLCETVDVLVEQHLITSGEVLARLLPQITSQQRAGRFVDPAMMQLDRHIYQAFRRRRSLLLLNMESQVRLEDIPWVAAVEPNRSKTSSTKEAARAALAEVAALTLFSFPHVVVPNKLLQEFRALSKDAELNLPLVDELAADIFMGQFTNKFSEAAKLAADLLDGSLYTRYYCIDWGEVRRLPNRNPDKSFSIFRWFNPKPPQSNAFAELCAARAMVPLGTWQPATNGKIIEQQQIVTTQNLASLIVCLQLNPKLRDSFRPMAEKCFQWVTRRMTIKVHDRHSGLVAMKNSAYAWRQMIFYLSLMKKAELDSFLTWSDEQMQKLPQDFRLRFQPTMRGLTLAASGMTLNNALAAQMGASQFLGWT